MSITSALNNALSGLTATSRAAEVVSSNLSNALTEGYGRRTAELTAQQIGAAGGGVQVNGVSRAVDPGLLADRRLADSALSGEQQSAEALGRLERAIGQPDDPAGLSARLAQFEQALISAGSDPASETRLSGVLLSLEDVVQTIQDNSRSIQDLRQQADADIARDVEVLNNSLVQVDALNQDIMRVRAVGGDPNALLDQRQQVVDGIADIVPVRELQRQNGAIGLMTVSGQTLLDFEPFEFGFDQTGTIVAEMKLSGGALSAITLDGVPLSPTNGAGNLDGGSLGASFALRDQTLVEAQTSLDQIAADLIARFEDAANDPTLAPGDPGLLTDQGSALDLTMLDGLAARLAINASVDPNQGGSLSQIRDGVNATTAGPLGSSQQIDNWIRALGQERSDVPGTQLRSASGRVADFTAQIGATRLLADERVGFTSARWDTLHEAELANGVDTDQELQTLLRIEQAYSANARVIQTVDFMMQQILEI